MNNSLQGDVALTRPGEKCCGMFHDIATADLSHLPRPAALCYSNALKSSLSWGTGIEK